MIRAPNVSTLDDRNSRTRPLREAACVQLAADSYDKELCGPDLSVSRVLGDSMDPHHLQSLTSMESLDEDKTRTRSGHSRRTDSEVQVGGGIRVRARLIRC